MRRGILAFWLGVVVTYLVLVLTASSSTLDVDVVPGEGSGIVVAERVDQGPLSRVLNPGIATLGTLRLTKRTWGVATTYTQELGVTAARLAQRAGTQISVKVSLNIPGTVVGTNASSRDGETLVWTEIPPDAPLWARTRAVNWPVALFAIAALAATVWLRAR
jgi:hypothetical protein